MLCDVAGNYFIALATCCALMLICGVTFACEPLGRWYNRRNLEHNGGTCYVDDPNLNVGGYIRSQHDVEI